MSSNSRLTDFQRDVLFYEHKRAVAAKMDLSNKGTVDDGVLELVEFLNNSPDYMTTSSCSGRVVLVGKSTKSPSVESGDEKVIKAGSSMMLVQHDPLASADVLMAEINKCVEISADTHQAVSLKFEPFILHVLCKNEDAARRLLHVAFTSGFKNSGITIGRQSKMVLAVRSTLCLELPIIHCGELLVTPRYVEFLTSAVNEKFLVNSSCAARLLSLCKEQLSYDAD